MKDSLYTIYYAAVMGLAAATLLTIVGAGTAPRREANEKAEEVRNVMMVLGVEYSPDASAQELIELFERKVESHEGKSLSYYTYATAQMEPGQYRRAFRFSGSGMWGPIEGFLALEPDGKTIAGMSVYRQEETPGLGAEIASGWFQEQFRGRRIYDQSGKPGINIVREREAEKDHEVDAITGATMSGDSLQRMMNALIEKIVKEDF